MDVSSLSVKFWLQNEKDCLQLVEKEWNKIPLLNANDVQDLQDKKLVRFRGMVQDMFNPEYYFEKYEVVNEVTTDSEIKNGKYMDTADCKDKEVINFDSDKNVTSERQTYVLISVPGLNKWAEDLEIQNNKIPQKQDASVSPIKTKRSHEDESMENDTLPEQPSTSSKKQCTESKPTTKPVVSKEHLLNFPLPNRTGKACHIKVYTQSDKIKLNDQIECVGFLSVDPILSQAGYTEDENEDSEMEVQTHNPPASLIPRIHCVSFKKIDQHTTLYGDEPAMPLETALFLRKELHIALTQLLFGDELAAEYLIYHLLSKVYLRKDFLSLGKFCLNISNVPAIEYPNYGDQLYTLLEQLVPKSHYLPMTLDNMNDLTFIPKKDYDCNRITSGILQLSNNTHLVLDETKLMAGKLNEAGVKAVGALSSVIKTQKTAYDFVYYPMEFDCDIPCLILSEGKSLLPSDFHIVLKPDLQCLGNSFEEIIAAVKVFLKPELLNSLRTYLAVQRHAKYELSDAVQEVVQQDFLDMRQSMNATPDDLHSLLLLARLVCLAEGKTVLDEVCWKRACQLETDRKARIPK